MVPAAPNTVPLTAPAAARCVFAIESDVVVQEQAWSSAD